MGQKVRLNEAQLKKIIAESVKKALNETFASRILKRLANEHGGIKGTSEWVDLQELTDDDMRYYGFFDDRKEFERTHSCLDRDKFNEYRIILFKDGSGLFDKRAEKGFRRGDWGDFSLPDDEEHYSSISSKELETLKKRKKRQNNRPNDDYIPLNKKYREKMGYR